MTRPLLAFFITFRTYGTWLPGDERGFTHHSRAEDSDKQRPAEPALETMMSSRKSESSRVLNRDERAVVDEAIRGVCEHRGWAIHALNVRSNHVHVVVQADVSPERVMNDFKVWATRRLRERGLVKPDERVWARHGSTVYVYEEEKLIDAAHRRRRAERRAA
jgi:REP element-mobilizing transposase RayT